MRLATTFHNEDQRFNGYERRLILAFGSVMVLVVVVITATLWFSLQQVAKKESEELATSFARLVAKSAETVGHAGKHHTQLLIEDYIADNPELLYILIQDENGGRFAASGPVELLDLESPESSQKARDRSNMVPKRPHFMTTQFGDLRELALPFSGSYRNKRIGTLRVGILDSQLERGLTSALPYVAVASILALAAALFIVTQLGKKLATPVRNLAREYANLMLNSPVYMALHDAEGQLLRVSESFRGLIESGLASDESLSRFLGIEDEVLWKSANERLVAGQEIVIPGEFEIRSGEVQSQFAYSRFLLNQDHDRDDEAIFCIVATDVTAQRKLEESLSQARSIETIGKFAGGVAHDFNNVLTAIQGFAELIKLDCIEGSETERFARDIVQSCNRAAQMAKRLLAFGRRQVLVPTRIELGDVVHESERFLRRLIREDIELSFDLPQGSLPVMADRGQIEQVLMNLVGNAADALPGRGRIEVCLSRQHMGSPFPVLGSKTLPEGDYANLRISDNGSGIPEEIRESIFDPFESTKGVGKGTGLGLFIVLGIVSRHDGGIRLTSIMGEGTTFNILLPLTQSPAVEKIQRQKSESPKTIRGSRLLIVEDDSHVRRYLREGLESLGVEIVTARDGQHAIDLFKVTTKPFDLVIMDVVMPRMNGDEAFRQLLALDPDLQVLFMTGYDDRALTDLSAEFGPIEYLTKPFALDALLERVQARLGIDSY